MANLLCQKRINSVTMADVLCQERINGVTMANLLCQKNKQCYNGKFTMSEE